MKNSAQTFKKELCTINTSTEMVVASCMDSVNASYCVQLNGEDLSRYSNKIESVDLRKCPYYRYVIEKVTSTDVRITNISQTLPHKMAENS